MFVLRPLKMTLCLENWFMEDAIEILQHTVLPTGIMDWVEGGNYAADTLVAERGYDFIALKDFNNTRPSGNFLGRSPRSDDSFTGSGEIAWVRKGYSGKYKCFATDAAGYTKSDGNFEVIITPSNSQMYPELVFLPMEKMYLFCGGIVGSSIKVTPLTFGGTEIVSGGVTKVLGSDTNAEVDYAVNPELPAPSHSFLFPTPFGLSSETNWSVTDAFKILISSISSGFSSSPVSYAENMYVGRLTRVGQLQWSNHNFVTEDRSKIVTDKWGLMSLSKRRVGKKVDCEVVITPNDGETIIDAVGNTLKFFSFLRGSFNLFILNNNRLDAAELNKLTEIPYGDAIIGLIKSCTISDFSASKAILKVTIASIPTGYKV